MSIATWCLPTVFIAEGEDVSLLFLYCTDILRKNRSIGMVILRKKTTKDTDS